MSNLPSDVVKRASTRSSYNKKPLLKKYCDECGTEYETNQPNRRFCSKECSKKFYNYERRPEKELTCHICTSKFISSAFNAKYCSKICANRAVKNSYTKAYKELKEITKNVESDKKSLKGYYVYLWLDDGEVFYVGIGCTKYRATSIHLDSDNKLSSAEIRRQKIGDKWKCRIIQDGLTEVGAKVIESVLIKVFRSEHNKQVEINKKYLRTSDYFI